MKELRSSIALFNAPCRLILTSTKTPRNLLVPSTARRVYETFRYAPDATITIPSRLLFPVARPLWGHSLFYSRCLNVDATIRENTVRRYRSRYDAIGSASVPTIRKRHEGCRGRAAARQPKKVPCINQPLQPFFDPTWEMREEARR